VGIVPTCFDAIGAPCLKGITFEEEDPPALADDLRRLDGRSADRPNYEDRLAFLDVSRFDRGRFLRVFRGERFIDGHLLSG